MRDGQQFVFTPACLNSGEPMKTKGHPLSKAARPDTGRSPRAHETYGGMLCQLL